MSMFILNISLLLRRAIARSSSLAKKLKVHLNPIFFSAEMKLSNIHKRNLPIFSVSDIFKGSKN